MNAVTVASVHSVLGNSQLYLSSTSHPGNGVTSGSVRYSISPEWEYSIAIKLFMRSVQGNSR